MFIGYVNSIRKKVRFIILAVPILLFADSWMMPYPKEYLSEDSTHSLIIIPGFTEESRLTKLDKILRNKVRPDVAEDYEHCNGELYRLTEDNKYQMIWKTQLVNAFSPVDALVSDDGNYIVTFDEWFGIGYGDNVVVIYGPQGGLIKAYALEDIISQEEIDGLSHSTTSRHWSAGRYLDEENKTSILCILTKGKQMYVREVRIDLKTGNFVPDDTMKIDTMLYEQAQVKPTPIYLPTIHIRQGYDWTKFKIKVELLVDIDGHVIYARIPKPDWVHKPYQEYALREAKKARFVPAKHEGKPVRVWVNVLYNVTASTSITLEIEN